MFHQVRWAPEDNPVVQEECAARAAYCLDFQSWNAAGSDPAKVPELPAGDASKADFFNSVASLFREGTLAPHSACNEFARLLKACDDATKGEAAASEQPANHVLRFVSDQALQIFKKAFICTPGSPITHSTFKNK